MRLIDKDELIADLSNILGERLHGNRKVRIGEVYRAIDNQQTINDWIPVSERLPDVDDTRELLVLIKRSLPIGVVANNPYTCKVAKFYDKYKGSSLYGGAKFYGAGCNPDCEVIAWMPLPEPYKESDK